MRSIIEKIAQFLLAIKSWLVLLGLVIVVISCSNPEGQDLNPDSTFYNLDFGVNSINNELGIEQILENNLMESENSITFSISNESNEILSLPDNIAGLRIFRYKDEINEWEEVFLRVYTLPYEYMLFPKNDAGKENTHEFNIELYFVDIHEDDQWLRFVIFGENHEKSKQYAAFVDVPVQEYATTRSFDDIFADFTPAP